MPYLFWKKRQQSRSNLCVCAWPFFLCACVKRGWHYIPLCHVWGVTLAPAQFAQHLFWLEVGQMRVCPSLGKAWPTSHCCRYVWRVYSGSRTIRTTFILSWSRSRACVSILSLWRVACLTSVDRSPSLPWIKCQINWERFPAQDRLIHIVLQLGRFSGYGSRIKTWGNTGK